MGLEHSILMQKQRWSQVCWHIIKTSHPETAKLKTHCFKLVSTFHYMREFSTCFTFQIANTFCSMYMWFFFEGLNQYSNAWCVTIKSSFTLSNINGISLYNINIVKNSNIRLICVTNLILGIHSLNHIFLRRGTCNFVLKVRECFVCLLVPIDSNKNHCWSVLSILIMSWL